MKMRTFTQMVLFGLVSALLVGCASTPVARNAAPQTAFQHPIDQVQKVAIDALVVTGFNVTKQEPAYVEGFRPRKVGLFVGSGGETVGIWLVEQGPNTTEVRVDTAKSLVGIVGQKNWDTEILNEMRKSLTQ